MYGFFGCFGVHAHHRDTAHRAIQVIFYGYTCGIAAFALSHLARVVGMLVPYALKVSVYPIQWQAALALFFPIYLQPLSSQRCD